MVVLVVSFHKIWMLLFWLIVSSSQLWTLSKAWLPSSLQPVPVPSVQRKLLQHQSPPVPLTSRVSSGRSSSTASQPFWTRRTSMTTWMTKKDNDDNDAANDDENEDSFKKKQQQQPFGSQRKDETKEEFQRRMAVVRALQMTYYGSSSSSSATSSSSSTTSAKTGPENLSQPSTSSSPSQQQQQQQQGSFCYLDKASGKLFHLPLARFPWYEVPGRSNVLNIHEPIYTNMFETILYKPKPWCFGHLYLHGGSQNLKSTNDDQSPYQLQTWKTFKQHNPSATTTSTTTAVLGTLMNICDYRRLADGRLLLLVHAMERFVVTDLEQVLPYNIVNAQILPDAEEMDPLLDFGVTTKEMEIGPARAMAVQESVRYHDYEYDPNHVLPIPDKPDLDVSDIVGSAIAKVLPYCPFSKTLEPPRDILTTSTTTTTTKSTTTITSSSTNHDDSSTTTVLPTLTTDSTSTADTTNSSDTVSSSSITNDDINSNNNTDDSTTTTTLLSLDPELPSLEYQLLCQGIYQTPLMDPEYTRRYNLTTDELEYELWLALNNFLIQTKTPVSPVLLGLLPPNQEWPTTNTTTTTTTNSNTNSNSNNFVLKPIVQELATLSTDQVDHDFVLVSPDYPVHRRQRRLSYSAAHLLESNAQVANELRAQLLAIPSTRQRLRFVLEKLDAWQESQWGEFQ